MTVRAPDALARTGFAVARPSGQVAPQLPAANRTMMPSSIASTTLRVNGWLGLVVYSGSQASWNIPQLLVSTCGVPLAGC